MNNVRVSCTFCGVSYADHAAEIERLSKERDEWEHRHNDAVMDLSNRLEAAESKLSQLQLANEEKAKKIVEALDPNDDQGQDWKDSAETIVLAILNGGQQ